MGLCVKNDSAEWEDAAFRRSYSTFYHWRLYLAEKANLDSGLTLSSFIKKNGTALKESVSKARQGWVWNWRLDL